MATERGLRRQSLVSNLRGDACARPSSRAARRWWKSKIVTDRDTGQPRGFAFVEMASPADAQAVMAPWDGQQLDGRSLKVNEAQERSGGGGGGGGRGGGGGGRGGGGRGGDRGGRYQAALCEAGLAVPGLRRVQRPGQRLGVAPWRETRTTRRLTTRGDTIELRGGTGRARTATVKAIGAFAPRAGSGDQKHAAAARRARSPRPASAHRGRGVARCAFSQAPPAPPSPDASP